MESLTDLQLTRFTGSISADMPCGENLEYDPDFSLLEREIQGTPERQSGDSVIPAEPPDWKKVRDLAYQLLARSHDIQISVYLTCALVHSNGFSGLSQGLALIHELLQNYWDDVYPLQDSDDDYPVLRMNLLSRLNDYDSIIGPVLHIPLTDSIQLGKLSWHDIEIAEGKIAAPADSEAPGMDIIEAAFLDTEPEKLQSLLAAIEYTLEQLQGIVAVTKEKAGEVNAPDLSALKTQLTYILRLMQQKVQQQHGVEPASDEQGTAGFNSDSISANTSAVDFSTGINNRKDVVRAIDAICTYFEQHEPSSPVPFLMQRSKKLLLMDFMEILQDLTPDAVSQAEKVCGVQDDGS